MTKTAVLLVCLVASSVLAADEDDEKINEIITQLGKAKYGHESLELYRSLFKAAGGEGLGKLKIHRDDSIAIQSAWEMVRLTVPENQGKAAYRPDPKTLTWFLGFLEGRMRVSPPEWWHQVVIDAR